jgi:hypothetical protein
MQTPSADPVPIGAGTVVLSAEVKTLSTDMNNMEGNAIFGFLTNDGPTLAALSGIKAFEKRFYKVMVGKAAGYYTLSYDGNGNDGGVAPGVDGPYVSGTDVTVAGAGTLTKTDARFLGWSTDSGAQASEYLAGDTFALTGDTTLYAVWKSTVTYTVTYHGNGNDGGTPPVDGNAYSLGENVSVAAPGDLVKTGHHFLGWSTGIDGAPPLYGVPGNPATDVYAITGNVAFYAVWEADGESVTSPGISPGVTPPGISPSVTPPGISPGVSGPGISNSNHSTQAPVPVPTEIPALREMMQRSPKTDGGAWPVAMIAMFLCGVLGGAIVLYGTRKRE